MENLNEFAQEFYTLDCNSAMEDDGGQRNIVNPYAIEYIAKRLGGGRFGDIFSSSA